MTADHLAERLREAGFEPDFNVCACGHHGRDHDLGNWCLLCPRPEMPVRPLDARLAAGWCYFGSMTLAEKWSHGISAILADGSVYLSAADYARLTAIEEAAREYLAHDGSGNQKWTPPEWRGDWDAMASAKALAALRTALEGAPL